jgi:hypothetical protein
MPFFAQLHRSFLSGKKVWQRADSEMTIFERNISLDVQFLRN